MLRLKDILKTSLKHLLEVRIVHLLFCILSAYSFYFSFFIFFFYLTHRSISPETNLVMGYSRPSDGILQIWPPVSTGCLQTSKKCSRKEIWL